MNPEMTSINAQAHRRELHRRASSFKIPHAAAAVGTGADPQIVVRLATPEDSDGLLRLTELEGLPLPAGDLLVAINGGEIRAALPLGDGPALADPFRPTAVIVAQLREARAHLRGDGRPSRGRRIGAAVGKVFSPAPSTNARGPATPGGEGRLIR